MRYLGRVALVMTLAAGAVSAEESAADAISTPGLATAEVSADQVAIRFQLEITSESFEGAVTEARNTAARLESVAPPSAEISVSVRYDVTLMRQKKWGRGSKLSQRFEMSVRRVPDGAAQETLVHFVDNVVKLEPRMTVEGYEASLSEVKSQRVRHELLAKAIENARLDANVIATASGLALGSPRSIVVGPPPNRLSLDYDAYGVTESIAVPARSFKSFTVRDELESKVPVVVGVWIVFNAKPQ